MEDLLKQMRDAGWRVAVHNDYEQGGEFFTFWLFTHPSGLWVKGEACSDTEAIAKAALEAREHVSAVKWSR